MTEKVVWATLLGGIFAASRPGHCAAPRSCPHSWASQLPLSLKVSRWIQGEGNPSRWDQQLCLCSQPFPFSCPGPVPFTLMYFSKYYHLSLLFSAELLEGIISTLIIPTFLSLYLPFPLPGHFPSQLSCLLVAAPLWHNSYHYFGVNVIYNHMRYLEIVHNSLLSISSFGFCDNSWWYFST